MGFYPDVNQGDPVTHIAGLENDIRHLVNAMNGFGDGAVRGRIAGGAMVVNVHNAAGSALSGAVTFCGSGTAVGGTYPVSVYVSGGVWGVLSAPIAPGGVAACVVGGIYTISGSVPGSGDYVMPVSGGTFSRCDTALAGAARVLVAGSDATTILIGHGEGGTAPSYSGYFKLVDASTYTSGALTTARVKVVDGANVSGGTAGYCDLSGCSAVGTATVSIGGTSAAVNLYGWYTSGGYSAAIGTSAPFSGNVGVYQLGHVEVSSGAITIVQDWQGGMVYFGLRYIL